MSHRSRYRAARRAMAASRNSHIYRQQLLGHLPDHLWERIYHVARGACGGAYTVLLHGKAPNAPENCVIIPRAVWRAGGAGAKICLEVP